MAERHFGFGYSPLDDVNWTVRVYDQDFSGTSTEIDIARGYPQIEWSTSETDDRHAPIFGSTCKVVMYLPVDDVPLTDFVDDVRTSKEGRFWIEVVSGSGPTVRWRGILVADISNERDEASRYAVTMSAVCGLALLKKIPYLSSGALITGTARLTKHLTNCLSKLSHAALWAADDDFLETSVDWWAETMSTGGSNDALYQAYADHAAFYDYKTSGNVDKDVLSCYDVIRNIAHSFGARIGMLDGKFKFEQIDYRSNSTWSYRIYKKDGTYKSAGTNVGTNAINQTSVGAKLSYVEYDYIPQLKKALVTYKNNLRRNFWGNIIPAQSTVFNFNQQINSNSGATTFKINGLLRVTIKNNSYSGSLTDSLFAEMKLYLKIGSNYLKRQVTYTGFTVVPGVASWTGTPGDSAVFVSGGTSSVPSVGNSVTLFVPVLSFITPPLPADGDTNSFECAFSQLKRHGNVDVDETQFTINWTADSFFLELYDGGTPDVLEDEILYETVNPDDGTAIWETDIRLGGGNANAQGGLSSVSNYKYQQWAQGTDTPDMPLGALVSKVVTDGQLRPIKRLNGQLRGLLSPWELVVTSDAIEWLPMRINYSPTENIIDGSWFEVDYGTAGVPSTPIKVKVLTGGTDLPQLPGPTIPTTTGNGNQGFATNSPGTVLAPVAFNNLSAAITKGATVTSIPLSVASTGDEFLAGDGVTLCHPITGEFQTFTIATAPVFGATSLSVTSATANFDAPVQSYLVVKQKAFAFSLPTAVQGQILRYDATDGRWEAYSGTVDGRVLTWDTTNGWQEESAGGISDGDKGDITVSASGATWTIDNNVVTLAKMATMATASFLGRTTGGTGNVEVLTATQSTAMLNAFTSVLKGLVPASGGGTSNYMRADGTWAAPPGSGVQQSTTLVAGRVALSNGSNLVTDNSNLRFDGTRLTIGAGTPTAFLNVFAGSLSGTQEMIRVSANVNGWMALSMINASNASGSAHSGMQFQVGGTAAGDPFVQFSVLGVGTVTAGVDNSDSDKFKITPLSTTPGGVANSGLIMTNEAVAKFGINKDAPIHELDITGRARASTGFIGQFAKWVAGNIAFGAGAGTGPTLNSISGTDNALYLSFTFGAGPVNNGVILTATYPSSWPNPAFVTFSAENNLAATNITKLRTGGRTAVKFDLVANGTHLAGDNFQLCFSIWGH